MERVNGTIKAKLRKAMDETGKGWVTCLPAVMLSLHIQPFHFNGKQVTQFRNYIISEMWSIITNI